MVEHSQALTVVEDRPVALRQAQVPWDSWAGMVEFAKIAHQAQGILPKHIGSWQGALLVMQKALELGVPPVEGLMSIYLVQGRVVVAARLMAGMVTRAFGPRGLEVIETTEKLCTVRYQRRGMDAPRELSWTIEQATKAQLAGKDVWKQYPRAMLRARTISEVCSFAYADVIGGMYVAGDLDDVPVRVTPEGEVEVDSAALASQQAASPIEPTSPSKADGDLPAPTSWVPELKHMAALLLEATGEDVPVPSGLSRAAGRALKAQLVDKLAEAEQMTSTGEVAVEEEPF